MRRDKYVFNKQTLQYEKVKLGWKKILVRSMTFFSIVLIVSFILYSFAYTIIPTPKEQTLDRELKQMEYHYASLSGEFEDLIKDIEMLQYKDAEVHRVIFGLDPIDEAVWEGGKGGHEPYALSTNFKNTGELISDAMKKVDELRHKVELQRNSLDTLYALAQSRARKLASIPSIKPVREDKLKRKMRHLSGYGIRIHPVHHVKKFHKGIDFTAPYGTAIQATGDGVVKRVENKSKGYGRNVIIDHGFGYTSLYAHMDEIDVKEGDKVVKCQKIGTVGSSGTSTAPHLHYEVRINNKPVNPIDYCMDGLTTEEYRDLVIKASIENQSLDY